MTLVNPSINGVGFGDSYTAATAYDYESAPAGYDGANNGYDGTYDA